MIVTRFAPSPTGLLHLGHAYAAITAYESGDDFLLRIEDIDKGRSRDKFIQAIFYDLKWLGLSWDEPSLRQSTRMGAYSEALVNLKARGLVYPCFCTRSAIAAEIAASAAAPHPGTGEQLYPGICRALDEDERRDRIAAERHAWRLDVAKATRMAGPLIWRDHGTSVPARPEQLGDVVLARKDAPTSYHLAVTVDDADQGVTDVVRGRDLFESTHVHRLLQALLDLPTPEYHHHALLTDSDGARLAKRSGAPSLASLRDKGVDPAELAANLRAGKLPAEFRIERF